MGSTCKVVCDTKVRTIRGSMCVTQSYRLSVSVTECVCNIYGLSWKVCQCDTKLWTTTVLGSTYVCDTKLWTVAVLGSTRVCDTKLWTVAVLGSTRVCDTKLWTVPGSLCMCVTQSYGLSVSAKSYQWNVSKTNSCVHLNVMGE